MNRKKTSKELKKHHFKRTTTVQPRKGSLKFMSETRNGVEKLFLSPLTQKFLDCRIGEDVTTDNPWVYVIKEKIEDNMFLHENSSEFLPMKEKIEKYPEKKMLIGSYSHIQDKVTDFFLCTNSEVKDDILEEIELDKKEIYQKIWNIMHPFPGRWKDLGSQIEVDESLSLKNRSNFEIILDTEYPIYYHNSKFTLCLVEDMPNSYVQNYPGRFVYNLVFRRRVDASTQSKLPTVDKGHQSELLVFRNKYAQYSYHCKKIQMTEESFETINKFFKTKCNTLFEILLVNFNTNFFSNDYKQLAKNYKGLSFKDPIELRSYQDVMSCKHKKVSCITWNAIVSGMVAVAYSITPINYLGKHPPMHKDSEDTVFENHFILLWTYKDNVRPKLYIHAYRDVTALSFCPYDENILVGGYSNGQIAVWDINNCIERVETREVLTHQEQQHRDFITKETQWIKPAFGIEHVFPTITSLFDSSHNSLVTSIAWIPPTHFISNMGVYERTKPNEEHMQFFTAALGGGIIHVWDLKLHKSLSIKIRKGRRPAQRLSKLPEALALSVSPLKKLSKAFYPHYRFYVKDPSTGIKSLLTNIVARNVMYCYDIVNPETISNIEDRTYFQYPRLLYPFNKTQKLLVSTALGALSVVKWDGSKYNQGLTINSETCTVKHFAHVHDGPILVCEINPFFPDVLLTVGGSIFAVWECVQLKVPLVWRKCNVRYISGMWSFRHPLTVFMVRTDSRFDIYNFLEQTEVPLRTYKFKGNKLITVFSDPTRLHTRKKTFVTTDIVGAIKVFNLPSGIMYLNESDMEESIKFINRIVAIKLLTEQLRKKYKKILETAALSKEVEEQEVPPVSEIPRFVKLTTLSRVDNLVRTTANDWQRRLEIHMTKILMQKKRLNIEDLERDKIPMQKLIDQEKSKHIKIEKKLTNRSEDFKKLKETLLVPVEGIKLRRKITVTIPKEMTKTLKQKFYDNYLEIERRTVEYMKNCCYMPSLD